MRNRATIGEYLAFLSTKYQIDPDQFFHALVSAEKNQEAACGELSIQRRSRNQDKTVMLVAKGQKVVAQFAVSKSFLQEQKNPIRDSLGTRFAGRCSTRKDRSPASLHIRDLRNGMKQISLKAKILEIPEPRMVYTRFGNYATVSNALIEDETGTIKLCLWNEQITSVAIGDTVFIENASMSRFKGESQLKIGRKGKLSNVNQPCTQMEALAQDKS
jgi:replication factor A1